MGLVAGGVLYISDIDFFTCCLSYDYVPLVAYVLKGVFLSGHLCTSLMCEVEQ